MYKELHDDYAVPMDSWEPTIHPQVGYVEIREDEELLGLAICGRHSAVEVEVHNALLPHLGWKRRVRVMREFFAWLEKCGFKRVIGKVPATNRYALKLNEAAGMKRFGVDERSFLRDGVLVDQVYFGLSLGCD